jgi:hypothetical protein
MTAKEIDKHFEAIAKNMGSSIDIEHLNLKAYAILGTRLLSL